MITLCKNVICYCECRQRRFSKFCPVLLETFDFVYTDSYLNEIEPHYMKTPLMSFKTTKDRRCVTEKQLSYFSTKTYVVGTQKNRLNETVLLSTQNIRNKLWVIKYLQFYAENVCLSKPVGTYWSMHQLIWIAVFSKTDKSRISRREVTITQYKRFL